MALCLCVSSVCYVKQIELVFSQTFSSSYSTPQISPKIRVLPSGTFFPDFGLTGKISLEHVDRRNMV